MRKKILTSLIFFLIGSSLFSGLVSAGVNVSVDNYFYVHSNTVGTKQYLKDKYGTTTLHGDAVEHDAVNTRITFSISGLQSGERLYVIYPDGSTQDVTGDSITLEKKEKYLKIAIDKTTTKETYVRINTQYTYDSADGGTDVYYAYNKSTPTTYGSLGDGGSGGGGSSGIDLQWNPGSRKFTWTKYPAEAYEIIVTDPDGVKYNIVPATKVFKANDGAGTYKFEVKKLDGTVLYTKSMTIEGMEEDPTNPTDPEDPTDPTDPTDPEDPPDDGEETPTCDGCDWLNEILFCPGWDLVMADLTLAIKDALPPPPDWWSISDMIGTATVRHLADYMGDVPEPPSEQEIEWATYSPLPEPDISTDTGQLVPTVPEEYNKGKIVFELNNGPEIEIKDESKPFIIDDPIANIEQKSDPVGTPVIPGDPRNDSDGIKEPDKPDVGGPAKPKEIVFELPRPTPKPETPITTAPVPSDQGGGAAIPDATEGPIPIPKGGGNN